MFSTFSKLVNYVFGDGEEREDDHDDNFQFSGSRPINPVIVSKQSDKGPEEKTFNGKVTSVHNGYGIIDNETYFSFKAVLGDFVPRVGDDVSVSAKRKHETGGWRAESVSPITQWDNSSSQNHDWSDVPNCSKGDSANTDLKCDRVGHEENEDSEHIESSTLVAMVSGVNNDTGTLNNTISFHFGNVRSGYVPYVGDWVTATVFTNKSSGTLTAEHIQPLREQEFKGTVNSVQHGFGYIDKEIYFSFGVCEGSVIPRRGDRVTGTSIESSRGRCSWRALTVNKEDDQLGNVFKSPTSLFSPTQTRNLSQLLSNKCDVSISEGLDFGQMFIGQKKIIQVFIRNEGMKPQVVSDHRLCKSHGQSQFHVSTPSSAFQQSTLPTDGITLGPSERDDTFSLAPKSTATVDVLCEASNLGDEKQLVIFEFDGFEIGREITVSVTDPMQYSIDPSSPYQHSYRRNYGRYKATKAEPGDNWLVPGQRPARSGQNVQLPNRLPQYPVPGHLEKCLMDKEDLVHLVPALGEELSIQNYTERFSALLHLEEIQQEIEMREFDMERVCLRPVGEFLALKVPGLAEGRPSLLIGDRVVLTTPGLGQMDMAPQYEGFVHEVLKDEILLKFSNDFHQSYTGEDYDVVFGFNRTTMRRCHQAVEFAPKLSEEVLFPTHLIPKTPQTKLGQSMSSAKSKSDVVKASHPIGIRKCPLGISPNKNTPGKPSTKNHKFYNEKLNTRQKAAVLRILSGQCRPMPYILFGPPGTGKTMTIVEAILQIFMNVPSSRIICCAPSNSAADLLAERLHQSGLVKLSDLVRMNAFQRIEEHIPESIKPYCSNGDNLELIARHRILVCTCTSAGMMYALGLKTGHFTHAFVDEAGQATEPECLVPTGLVAGQNGQIILAGDPMQLGPVLRSKIAKAYGLEQSFLERLIQRNLYARDEVCFADHGSYDPLLVTKLVENYRCHPFLLEVSSQLFYHGELEVSADKLLIECLCKWEQLPTQGFPVIFHGIKGQDLREGNSPSWFNPMEAVQVMRYLQALVGNDVHPLTFDDIGIITPYRKQVEKIRLLIDRLGMEKVKVGSVEEFQGQERLTMIISTVRSSDSQVGVDVLHNLGFLRNAKRFNVAISRAQAAMIVIGNPHLLAQDPNWKLLLQFCVKHGGYIGCDLPDLGLEKEHVTSKIPSKEECIPCASIGETDKKSCWSPSHSDVREDEEGPLENDAVESMLLPDTCTEEHQSRIEEVVECHRMDNLDDHQEFDQATSKGGETDLSHLVDDIQVGISNTDLCIISSDDGEQGTCARNQSEAGPDTLDVDSITQETQDSSTQETQDLDPEVGLEGQSVQGVNSENDNLADETEKVITKEETCSSSSCHLSNEMSSQERYESVDKTDPDTLDVDSITQETQDSSTQETQDLDPEVGLEGQSVQEVNSENDNLADETEKLITKEETYSSTSCLLSNEMSSQERYESVDKTQGTCDTLENLIDDNSFSKSNVNQGCLYRSLRGPGLDMDDIYDDKELLDEQKAIQVCVVDSFISDLNAEKSTTPEADSQHTPLRTMDDNFVVQVKGINIDNPVKGTEDDAQKEGDDWETEDEEDISDENIEDEVIVEEEETVVEEKESKVARVEAYEQGHKLSGIIPPFNLNNADKFESSMEVKKEETNTPYPEDGNLCEEGAVGETPLLEKSENNNLNDYTNTMEDIRNEIKTLQTRMAHEVAIGKTEEVTNLDRKIIRQVEYYFSDYNLVKDVFLQDVMESNEGWLPLDTLIKFNRMKNLSQDFSVITSALRKSNTGLIKIHPSGSKIQRSADRPLPSDTDAWRNGLKRRTVYVTGLPTRQNILVVEQYFNQFGPTEHIEFLPWVAIETKKRKILTQPVLVVFKSRSFSQGMLLTPNLKYDGRFALRCSYREDTYEWLFGNKKEEAWQEEKKRRQENQSGPRGRGHPRNENAHSKWQNQPSRLQNNPAYREEENTTNEGRFSSQLQNYVPRGRGRGKNPRWGGRALGTNSDPSRASSQKTVDLDRAQLSCDRSTGCRSEYVQNSHGNEKLDGARSPVPNIHQDKRKHHDAGSTDYYVPVGRGRGRAALLLEVQDRLPGIRHNSKTPNRDSFYSRTSLSEESNTDLFQTHSVDSECPVSPVHWEKGHVHSLENASSQQYSNARLQSFKGQEIGLGQPDYRGTPPSRQALYSKVPGSVSPENDQQPASMPQELVTMQKHRLSLDPSPQHINNNDEDCHDGDDDNDYYGLVQHDSDVIVESSSEESVDED